MSASQAELNATLGWKGSQTPPVHWMLPHQWLAGWPAWRTALRTEDHGCSPVVWKHSEVLTPVWVSWGTETWTCWVSSPPWTCSLMLHSLIWLINYLPRNLAGRNIYLVKINPRIDLEFWFFFTVIVFLIKQLSYMILCLNLTVFNLISV